MASSSVTTDLHGSENKTASSKTTWRQKCLSDEVNYSDYPISRKAFKVKACVDWLTIAIRTSRPTQFRRLQAEFEKVGCGKLHVEPMAEGAGGVAEAFMVTFHDDLANDVAALKAKLGEVDKSYPMIGEPSIAAIEIACDFRHKGPAALHIRDTLAMTYRLQSSLFAKGATKPRQFDPALGEKGANRFMDVEGARLDPGLNFRIGNKWDSLSWQVYFKWTDKKRNDDVVYLPQSKWRARVEVTMRGDALQEYGLLTLSDLESYSFNRLTPLFRFRRPIAPAIQAAGDPYKLMAIVANRRINDATCERGMHSFNSLGRRDYRWRNGLREESRHIEPDDELQAAVKGALRRLSVG